MRRDVTLMHGVAAPEKHGEGHARAVEMRCRADGDPCGSRHSISRHCRSRPHNRRTESRYDPCFSRPPDSGPAESKTRACRWKRSIRRRRFSFVKISALIAQTHHDFRRAGDALVIPIIRSGWRAAAAVLAASVAACFAISSSAQPVHKATRERAIALRNRCWPDIKMRTVVRPHTAFNPKDLGRDAAKKQGFIRLFLPRRPVPDCLSGRGFHMDHRLFAVLVIVCFALGRGRLRLQIATRKPGRDPDAAANRQHPSAPCHGGEG